MQKLILQFISESLSSAVHLFLWMSTIQRFKKLIWFSRDSFELFLPVRISALSFLLQYVHSSVLWFPIGFFLLFPVTADVTSFSTCQKCLNILEFVDTGIVLFFNALTFWFYLLPTNVRNLKRKKLFELVLINVLSKRKKRQLTRRPFVVWN